MKIIPSLLFLILILSGCATTSTSHIQQGKESELKEITTVAVGQFQSSDEAISQAVRNTIIEMLLPSGVRIINNKASADVVIEGSITFSHDATAAIAGSYVSGITAQLIRGDEIIAAASETQGRSAWIPYPDPPEVMARKIGKKIKKMFGR
ncbi:MAG: hypothetical protein AB1610_05460 [Nitrospirota bacterium]